MSESSPVRRRIWWKLFLLLCVFIVVALGLLGWYVTTDSFQQAVRRRMVAALEQATGGRVELGEFHTIPLRLRFDARNLTVHGRESADQLPLLHVDRVQAELKIISLLTADVRLHTLILEHPVVHVLVYPDGSTNQPAPPLPRSSSRGPVEELFSLSVSRIEVQRGELLWEDKTIPFDLGADDLDLTLRYSFLHRQYGADFAVGNVATRWQQHPPLRWHARASLVLARDHADIRELKVGLPKSEVQFTGRVQGFHDPQISGDYRGTVDLAELASFVRLPEVRRGTARLQGKGSWSFRDFSTQGNLQASDLEGSNNKLKLQNGRLAAAFLITPQRLRISSIKANLFGGELLGDVDVTNWLASQEPPPVRRPTPKIASGALQRGSVQLKLSNFPTGPVLAEVSSKKFPLDRLRFTANASGNIDMIWVGSIRDAETRLNLALAAPPRTSPGQLPVHGEISGTYRASRGEVDLSQFHLVTPASEVHATGNPPAPTLRLSFSSHDLEEWRPLLQAVYGNEELPFAIRGWVNFNGSATQSFSSPQLNGSLEVYDFETTLPGSQHRPPHAVHWDALTSAVQYSPGNVGVHNGVLLHGHATVRIDGNISLARGKLPENSPFNVHFDVRNGDIAEITQLAGSSLPLRGTLHLTASISGTPAHPRVEGHLGIRDGMAYGVPVPSLRSDLRLEGGEFQFDNLESTLYDAPISGSGAWNAESGEFRLNLSGRDLDLGHLPKFHTPRFTVDGRADFTLQARGTREKPSLETHVHVRDLAFDKELAGEFFFDAVPHGDQLSIQAHSNFERAQLNLQGNVGLERDLPADLNLSFRHLDIDSLLALYVPGQVTAHSTVAGTIALRGPLRAPRELRVSGQFDSLEAEVEHISVHNAEPIRFEVGDQVFRLESFHLAGNGTDFTAQGRAHLTNPREMEFRLDGTVNVALLQSLNPKLTAHGAVGVSLTAAGTLAAPVLQGRLEVKDTSISHNDFPSGLSGLNGVLLFDQNRLQIESLTGTTGGGTVSLTGSGSYERGTFLMDLNAVGRDVRLRYPAGVSSTANANLHLTGSTAAALLSGDLVINKLAVNPGADFGAYLEKSKQGVTVVQHDSLASRLKLDVHVSTSPELQMQTAMAKLSGNSDLRIRGTADRPVITGRASANEGGEISFNGTKYHVDRLEVTFSNPAKTTPNIDLQATTRVRDYDITVALSGDLSVPNGVKATWRSEPPLPEADVIELLALGRTREEAAALQGTGGGLGSEASGLLINQAINSAVTSRVQRLFGVSRIKIDPQGMASSTNLVRGPQVTVEQQVASKLTLTYSTNVSVAAQQIIQVEYSVTRNVSIVGLRDQNGVVSFDIKVRQRKR